MHGGHEFNEEIESSPKKTKTGASRGPADILPWKSRASRGQDEIAILVKDDTKSLVGQIVCKQWDDSYFFDSLTVSFDDSVPEILAHIIQKPFLRRKLKIN